LALIGFEKRKMMFNLTRKIIASTSAVLAIATVAAATVNIPVNSKCYYVSITSNVTIPGSNWLDSLIISAKFDSLRTGQLKLSDHNPLELCYQLNEDGTMKKEETTIELKSDGQGVQPYILVEIKTTVTDDVSIDLNVIRRP